VSVRIGYKASAEQFGPAELLEYAVLAERAGFEIVAISDHFQPWRHHGGHSPAALPWLGAACERTTALTLGTSVLTPTLRYEPAVIAQAFATLACLAPGRVFLGVGTGEAMNETPVTGGAFPGRKERRMRLAEAIRLIRTLWTDERVDFAGDYYRTERATIYDRPEQPPPIYVAASGPLAAKLAGRAGDGFICTSGKDPALYEDLLSNVAAGAEQAGRDAGALRRMIEVKVSYDRDRERALTDTHWWAALALTPEEKRAARTRSRWSGSPTPTSSARTRASSAPTIPRRSSRRSAATPRSASTSSCCTRPGRTRRASSSSSPPTCCRCCASRPRS